MIDLQRPRDVGELLTVAFTVFGRRWHVFLAMTFVVVCPATVLLDGVWGRTLADGVDARPPLEQQIASGLINAVIVSALVTGLHCIVVAGLAAGTRVTLGSAFRDVAPRSLAAMATAGVFVLGVIGGLALLVVPGLWLAIRWYFGIQAAVLERRGPWESLERSGDLVAGSWWRVAGLLFLISFVASGIVSPLLGLGAFGDGVVYTGMLVVFNTVTMSLTAIFGTLLFFDLRARRDAGPAAEWVAREARHEWLPPQPPRVPGA